MNHSYIFRKKKNLTIKKETVILGFTASFSKMVSPGHLVLSEHTTLSLFPTKIDAYCEVPEILFMIQFFNIRIYNLSTDSSSNKPPRILLFSRAPARCDDTGTKLNMLYRVYIKVSQNETRRTNIFKK